MERHSIKIGVDIHQNHVRVRLITKSSEGILTKIGVGIPPSHVRVDFIRRGEMSYSEYIKARWALDWHFTQQHWEIHILIAIACIVIFAIAVAVFRRKG